MAGKRVRVAGLVSLGPSFGADGNLITSRETYLDLFPANPPGSIEIGLVRTKSGSNIESIVRSLNASLPNDVRVISLQSFIDFENYKKDVKRTNSDSRVILLTTKSKNNLIMIL